MKVTLTSCQTSLGWIGIAGSPQGLLALTLPQPTRESALAPLLERWGQGEIENDSRLDNLKGKLQYYLAGERVVFDEPLDLSGATPFQRRVWLATREIPYGERRSYAQIARRVGSPQAAQAVGQALAANPLPLIIPCHRVVASSGDLGGFSGGPYLKRRLLEMEGAT